MQDATPAGVIDLSEATAVRVVADYIRKRRPEHLFCIVLPQRTFNIIAPDADTRQQWVDAIAAKLPPAAAGSADEAAHAGKTVPVTAADGADEDIVESSEEDDDEHVDDAQSDGEGDETTLERLRARCVRCKEAVEHVLFAEPEAVRLSPSTRCSMNDTACCRRRRRAPRPR